MPPAPTAAFASVQDGLTDAQALEVLAAGAAGLFVGGTLEWKLATAAHWVELAHGACKPCHVGRMGTGGRVRWAKAIQADSIDSCLPLFSDANLSLFLRALGDGWQMDLYDKGSPVAPVPRQAIPVRKPKPDVEVPPEPVPTAPIDPNQLLMWNA